MNGPLLLDTNVCIWLLDGALKKATADLVTERSGRGEALHVSPYVAWELAGLLRHGKLRSSVSADEYFRRLVARPGIVLAELSPEVLIASWFLPGDPPKDPADRIMAATARVFGFTLVTRDRELLDYAAEGHLSAIGC